MFRVVMQKLQTSADTGMALEQSLCNRDWHLSTLGISEGWHSLFSLMSPFLHKKNLPKGREMGSDTGARQMVLAECAHPPCSRSTACSASFPPKLTPLWSSFEGSAIFPSLSLLLDGHSSYAEAQNKICMFFSCYVSIISLLDRLKSLKLHKK
jgi:hypothetical protein